MHAFLGYYVLLIEGAKMAQSWRTGAHLPMHTTFGEAVSPLGLGALEAHRPDTPLPDATATLTGLEFAEKYLVPLSTHRLVVRFSTSAFAGDVGCRDWRRGASRLARFKIAPISNFDWPSHSKNSAVGIRSAPILCSTARASAYHAGSDRAAEWPWAKLNSLT